MLLNFDKKLYFIKINFFLCLKKLIRLDFFLLKINEHIFTKNGQSRKFTNKSYF